MSVTAKPGFKSTRIKRTKGDIAFTVVNTLCMVLFCLAILYPVLNVVSVSLSKDSYVYSGAVTFYPKGFQTQSYKTVLTSYSLWRSFANSIFVSAVGTLLTLIFTSLAAYPPGLCKVLRQKALYLHDYAHHVVWRRHDPHLPGDEQAGAGGLSVVADRAEPAGGRITSWCCAARITAFPPR